MIIAGKYALLSGTTVVNIIAWDGDPKTFNPAPLTAVPYDPTKHVLASDPRELNRTIMRDRLAAVIAANNTFGAIASPTTAQVTAQAKALTKQCTGLAKLMLDLLDDTTGT